MEVDDNPDSSNQDCHREELDDPEGDKDALEPWWFRGYHGGSSDVIRYWVRSWESRISSSRIGRVAEKTM